MSFNVKKYSSLHGKLMFVSCVAELHHDWKTDFTADVWPHRCCDVDCSYIGKLHFRLLVSNLLYYSFSTTDVSLNPAIWHGKWRFFNLSKIKTVVDSNLIEVFKSVFNFTAQTDAFSYETSRPWYHLIRNKSK